MSAMMADHELARRGEGGIELRTEPVRVRWSLDDLSSADGHRLRGDLACSVQPLHTPTERRMLEEAFLAHDPALTVAAVVSHFEPEFRATIAQAVADRDVAACLEGPVRQTILDALRSAGRAVAFSCGLELLEPFELHLDSPTLRQQRIEDSLRRQAQQRQHDQLAHAEWAAKLLKQFEPVRHTLPPSRILQQFPVNDQGKIFEVLTQAAADDARRPSLWMVSGSSLVRAEPRSAGDVPQQHPLPDGAGPLRSVHSARIGESPRLLVGAAAGVLVVEADNPHRATIYRDEEITSPRGFTRAIVWQDELWACHSDGGIVAWKLDAPDRPVITLRPPQLADRMSDARTSSATAESGDAGPGDSPEAKHLLAVDDTTLLFSAGGRLVALRRDQRIEPLHLEPRSEIVSLLAEPDHIVAVHAGGEICRRSRATLEMTSEQLRSEKLACAAVLPWLGDVRLLLGAATGGIRCVSLQDPLVTEYTGWHGTARALSASADLIAALSPDRQRIVLWETWQNRRPLRELHISALTRHRIADLSFALV